ncbi:putative protein phosphatase 2C 39 [Senna tora]|uniref:Uncharacterized protein n=1 Tax=Senna tora TaxID=362788 RepID=A0A834W000_9FABA|nr:putative protein phosphatase 2C 39 [Senna tora]
MVKKLTFHIPSLAMIRNSVSSSTVTTTTSGSELRCIFKLLSPKALATASLPSTRGTSPARNGISELLSSSTLPSFFCFSPEVTLLAAKRNTMS